MSKEARRISQARADWNTARQPFSGVRAQATNSTQPEQPQARHTRVVSMPQAQAPSQEQQDPDSRQAQAQQQTPDSRQAQGQQQAQVQQQARSPRSRDNADQTAVPAQMFEFWDHVSRTWRGPVSTFAAAKQAAGGIYSGVKIVYVWYEPATGRITGYLSSEEILSCLPK